MSNFKTRMVVTIEASSEDNAEKIKEVINNILDNVSESTLCSVIYPKIKKNPAFFAKVANNSLIKML